MSLLESHLSTKTAYYFQRAAAGAAIAVGLLGFLRGLLGWFFNIDLLKLILPNLATMKTDSSLLFVLASVSLFLQNKPIRPRTKWVALACAMLVFVIGILTLTEYIFGADLGIDSLLFRVLVTEADLPFPGRMAPNSALNFVLLGAALLLLDVSSLALRGLAASLCLVAFFVAYVALAGYGFHVSALYSVPHYASMAIHTASGFAVLSVGILFSRPQSGLITGLAQEGPAGFTARRLLPVVLTVPIAIGWLQLKGQRAGLYDAEFGLGLMVTSCAFVLGSLVLWNAYSQDVFDGERQQSLRDELFLFDLAELLRTSTDSTQVLFHVSERLGKYLEASRCYFNVIDNINNTASIQGEYYQDKLSSMVGITSLASYNHETLMSVKAGHTIVIEDYSVDPRIANLYEKVYRPLGMRASVGIPLLRDGQWVSTLVVARSDTHTWQAREVGIIELVSEKTWLWLEHLRTSEALHRRERALAESEARYRDLYENSPDMYASVNAVTNTIIDCNRTLITMLGYSREELIGRPILELYHPDCSEAVQAAFGAFYETGKVHDTALELRKKDGSGLEVSLNVNAVRGADGGILSSRSVWRDISGRRQLEQMQQRDRFFQLSIDMVCVSKEDYFTQINPAFEKTLGYSSEELLSQPFSEWIHPDDKEPTRQELERRAVTPAIPTLDFTNRFRCKDGSYRWLQWRSTPDRDGAWYSIARDITKDREVEQELLRKQVELTSSLREREVLLQEVHHRVKNNLQIVSSLINMQMRQLKDPLSRSALVECKSRIETIALIHENLYRSRNYANIQFSGYIKELTANIFYATGVSLANIAFTVEIEDVSLSVDKAIPCGLILNELITNAVKHAFPDGRGSLRIELQKLTEQDIVLVVSDNGVGLPPQFDMEKSQSLGMTLVSTLVEQLDGELIIVRDAGTSFRITFPLEAKQ